MTCAHRFLRRGCGTAPLFNAFLLTKCNGKIRIYQEQNGLMSKTVLLRFPTMISYWLCWQRELYRGERSTRLLVQHALQSITSTYHKLSKGSFKWKVEEDTSGQPWLITFCGDDGGEGGKKWKNKKGKEETTFTWNNFYTTSPWSL